MSSQIEISVVTGTYNRFMYLSKMVASLRESIGVGLEYEIIVVDGGSVDGSIAWCKTQDDIRLIEQGELLGAVKAFNAGFAVARGRYVLIANDDIEFVGKSVMRAFAYMQDHPEVGIGCFAQKRPNYDDFKYGYMPAIVDGQYTKVVYGQVCMVPKWLGDEVGWWGTYLHTYGGDNELTGNVLEKGFAVQPIPEAKILDFKIQDALRIKNNPGGHHSSDTSAWRMKWTRNGELGPRINSNITSMNPLERRDRVIFAPGFTSSKKSAGKVQRKQKVGFLNALRSKYAVQMIDVRQDKDGLFEAMDMFRPKFAFIQCHSVNTLSVDDIARLRSISPSTKLVGRNGDYRISTQFSAEYLKMVRELDILLLSAKNIADAYKKMGINGVWWPQSFEHDFDGFTKRPLTFNPCDVIFTGNDYNRRRHELGLFLSKLPYEVSLYGHWRSPISAKGNTIYNYALTHQLYAQSKVIISDCPFPKSYGYVSNRLFQGLYSGRPVFQEYTRHMEFYFKLTELENIIFWKDLEELAYKLKKLLPFESELNRIGSNGRDFVIRNHSYKVRLAKLEEELEKL